MGSLWIVMICSMTGTGRGEKHSYIYVIIPHIQSQTMVLQHGQWLCCDSFQKYQQTMQQLPSSPVTSYLTITSQGAISTKIFNFVHGNTTNPRTGFNSMSPPPETRLHHPHTFTCFSSCCIIHGLYQKHIRSSISAQRHKFIHISGTETLFTGLESETLLWQSHTHSHNT